MTGWIGVDLDGTLARYDTWKGPETIGPPIPEMVFRVRTLLLQGWDVRIFTARVSDDPNKTAERHIQRWCEKHIGITLPVTCIKDFGMLKFYDDRAVQMEPNTGQILGVDIEP